MKVLVIGLGSIAKKHIKALTSLVPTVEIFALRSSTDSTAYLNVKDIHSLDEISSIKIDFAIVSNPTSEHKRTIERLIPFRFPLFIEKPIHSSLDIEETISLVSGHGILTYVACNLRFLDCIEFIKHQVPTSKRLNEVNVYCGSYLPEWRPGTYYKKSYSALAELGGGVHIDLIHELDYLYWLYGYPLTVTRAFRNQSSLAISAIDYANYLLEFEGFCSNVILNYFRRDPKRSMELVFDDETWYVDLLKNKITCNDRVIFKSEQRIQDTYQKQMEYFIDCLKGQRATFNPISEACNVLKICLGK